MTSVEAVDKMVKPEMAKLEAEVREVFTQKQSIGQKAQIIHNCMEMGKKGLPQALKTLGETGKANVGGIKSY